MYAGDVDTLCHLAAFLTIRKSQHREAAILYERALLVAPDCTVYIQTMCVRVCIRCMYTKCVCVCVCVCAGGAVRPSDVDSLGIQRQHGGGETLPQGPRRRSILKSTLYREFT